MARTAMPGVDADRGGAYRQLRVALGQQWPRAHPWVRRLGRAWPVVAPDTCMPVRLNFLAGLTANKTALVGLISRLMYHPNKAYTVG